MRALPLIALLAACGSGTGTESASDAPTFTEIRDDILLPSCALSTCHLPGEQGATESGLAFDPAAPGDAYGAIVNATGASGLVLVTPGDVDNSFLVRKVTGDIDVSEGDPMPPPFGLDSETSAKVVAWVEAGAAND